MTLDQAFVDFDSVRYHLSTTTKKSTVLLSIHVRCWDELVKYGVMEIIEREYGQFVTETEQGYNLSLLIDIDTLDPDPRQSSPSHATE